nr:glycosyltransferase [uncultured Celeribacter sp.]
MPRLTKDVESPGLPRCLDQADLDAIARVLDPQWYGLRELVRPADLAEQLAHFGLIGWREGRAPCADFDLVAALAAGTEGGVRAYLKAGCGGDLPEEGPSGSAFVAAEAPYDPRLAAAFDAAWYRDCYGETVPPDQDLLDHFMTEGWKQGHDPSPCFDTAFYLEQNPDIARSGINPFEHYVLFGRAEGRLAQRERGLRLGFDPMATSAPASLAGLLDVPPAPARHAPTGPVDFSALDIHWIIPDFTRGGGGHMTIFRMIRHMEMLGHRCTIWIERRDFHMSLEEAYDDIVRHFQCLRAEVRFLSPALYGTQGDIVVATGWTTAYCAAACRGFRERFYFVQDHEAAFYAEGAEAILARASYDLDLACICASPWLDQLMAERYGRWSRAFHLAYDPEIYHPQGRRLPLGRAQGLVRLCVYARDHTPRRAVALALLALDELGRRGVPVEVHFFGQTSLPFFDVPYAAVNHGVLDAPDLAALYRSCDLGLCFSATNYSLIPQEMMACGLPVVELDGDSTRAVFPDGVVAFAGPEPRAIARTLEGLLRDPAARAAQSRKARAWVGQFSWEAAAEHAVAAFVARLEELGACQSGRTAARVRRLHADVVDVVVPTWNGGEEIKQVIAALRAQEGRARPNIICVDSSSTDGTTAWLQAQPDLTVKVIAQEAFQHGRTRNLGASLGTAPLIAFLTQDAIPAHRGWLHDIWAMMTHYPQAAGLFGRHVAHPAHAAYLDRDLEQHFDQFLKLPLLLTQETSGRVWGADPHHWARLLRFYSDNNSCMRRSVWEKLPYPEVSYGEDQIWARRALSLGYGRLYAPTATVFHSHDYTPEETYERSRTEAAFFLREFDDVIAPTRPVLVEAAIRREQSARRAVLRQQGVCEQQIDLEMARIVQRFRGYADGILSVRGHRAEA